MGIFDIVYYKSSNVYFRINKITDRGYDVSCTIKTQSWTDIQFIAHIDITKDIITIDDSCTTASEKMPSENIQYILKHLTHKTDYVIVDKHSYNGYYGICSLPTKEIKKGELDNFIRSYISDRNNRILLLYNILKFRKN